MQDLPIGNITADDYRRHLVKAKTFQGSAAEYCRQHKLDQNRFSYFKTRAQKKSGFARVMPMPAVGTEGPVRSRLPDPMWLAKLICELAIRS